MSNEGSNPCGDACQNLGSGLDQTIGGTGGQTPARPGGSNVQAVDLDCTGCNGVLVFTVTRNRKELLFEHNGMQKWDCTIGEMVVDHRPSRSDPRGKVVYTGYTVERGGPTTRAFVGESHRVREDRYEHFGQMAIYPRSGSEAYGLGAVEGISNSTYQDIDLPFSEYGPRYPQKSVKNIALAIHGPGGLGIMDRRTEVLMHCTGSHTGVIGCMAVTKDRPSVVTMDMLTAGDRKDFMDFHDGLHHRRQNYIGPWYTRKFVNYSYVSFSLQSSWAAMHEIIDLLEKFKGGARLPSNVHRLPNVYLDIIEEGL